MMLQVPLRMLYLMSNQIDMKIKQHKESRVWSTLEVKRGKLSQKAKLREQGIWTWKMSQLAAKGI